MSRRDPFPSPKLENDFTLSGYRPQQRTFDESSQFFQTDEPWSRLHDTATLASTRRSDATHQPQAPRDSLDFHLSSIYDHHKDLFWTKNQTLCQRETLRQDHRKRENLEKQRKLAEEQANSIRVWVDPKRSSIHCVR
ncbi:protein C1orf194 homolog [Fundulus heteroclitus]|uniref:protein C1orf194 homolog n=1 Tax=Fundulus heteroclitus TaxID=8078 RepID=UPI00165CD307|nr:protein C1orf194 homolog [Fundulus heteroclitus]XP_035993089.1 protein C1orf194 homolog [Fundulus heteroclitus]